MTDGGSGSALRPVRWVGSSLDDLRSLPEDVKDSVGFVLDRVQRGLEHRSVRSLATLQGVWEIRVAAGGEAYRVVYATGLGDAIYVLHAFRKRSASGIATPARELRLVRRRLRAAREDARRDEER